MKTIFAWILVLVALFLGVTWFLSQGEVVQDQVTGENTTDEPVTDDKSGPTISGDYIGMTEATAVTAAEANGDMFRVVKRDGELLMVTEDFRPGRINAVVEGGVVTSYEVEGGDVEEESTPVELDLDPDSAAALIGMTVAEAEAYAATNDLLFRVGSVDGELFALTMDYRPGRITAVVAGGVVTDYSVE